MKVSFVVFCFIAAHNFAHATEIAKPLQPLVSQLLVSGVDSTVLQGPLAKALGFSSDVPAKVIEILLPQTTDGNNHASDLVVSKSTGVIEPIALVFMSSARRKTKSTAYFFRVNLNGDIEKSFVLYGNDDKSGKPIKGSGHLDVLDIKSRDVRKRFQHELDFWLKGFYRKK